MFYGIETTEIKLEGITGARNAFKCSFSAVTLTVKPTGQLESGIDTLKEGLSLLGLAIAWLFSTLEETPSLKRSLEVTDTVTSVRWCLVEVFAQSIPMTLRDECDKDLHHLFKDNLVGGPSLVASEAKLT